jgi:excinuclease ABC subunit C
MLASIIENLLANLPETSGIYQFFDQNGKILYIGKAKNLKKRIASYAATNRLSDRIKRMVFLAAKLEFINTKTELEALLLEHNLIKKYSPKFNILLKDDKTFPYILIAKNHNFPAIIKHRGVKNITGNYFGPFASASDVNKTIDLLRKSFLLRNCSDSEFLARKKPCLEYQIKRCNAPCVNLISKDDYQKSVNEVLDFLDGKSLKIQKELAGQMQELSSNLEYEKAAVIRDKIKSLSSIQAKQNINNHDLSDSDIITLVTNNNKIAILISFYRGGNNYGSKCYFYDRDLFFEINNKAEISNLSKQIECNDLSEFLAYFIGQFYLNQTPPNNLLLNLEIDSHDLIENYLSELSNKKIKIITPKKGNKYQIIKSQEELNIRSLQQEMLKELNNQELLIDLKKLFKLEKTPERIEVYDNSHIGGQYRIGAMICANQKGFDKNSYRRFNLDSLKNKQDDTAMLKEVLNRRFKRLILEDSENKSGSWPDLVIIDGGKPQLSAAKQVFDELLTVEPEIIPLKTIMTKIVAMSKGPNRNAGEEYFHQLGSKPLTLTKNNPLMFYLQRLRDEAHRFAITNHKNKRSKSMSKSSLDEIAGIGQNKKKLLLNHFGSLEKIKSATIQDLLKIKGISKSIAKKILDNKI